MPYDIKKAIEEAEKETSEEDFKDAKRKIKTKLKEIKAARKIVRNLENEYKMLLEELGDN